MGSSNAHNYRGYGFNNLRSNNELFSGLSQDMFVEPSYGFPTDLTKTERSGTARHLPNEVFKLDPSDPRCFATDAYVEGGNITTINNLGSIGDTGTNATIFPVLQFPKIYTTAATRHDVITAPMLAFNTNIINGTTFSFGSTGNWSFLAGRNVGYSIYYVLSFRQNVQLTSPVTTPTANDISIFRTIPNSNVAGIVCGLATSNNSVFAQWQVSAGGGGIYSIIGSCRIIRDYRNLQNPIVVSMLCTNEQRGDDIGYWYVNGVKTDNIEYNGNPFPAAGGANHPLQLFKRSSTTGNLLFNMIGSLGDIRIFNTRHDEGTHKSIVDMLMKKYKISL